MPKFSYQALVSILLLPILLLALRGAAQSGCATDLLHQQFLTSDPSYREHFETRQNQLRELIRLHHTGRGNDANYTIPVVVHVIHTGGQAGTGDNISDQQIIGAISGLNERFSDMRGVGVATGISFCLAVRDPNGCPTNGINRVDGSQVPGYLNLGIGLAGCPNAASESAIKDLSHWPQRDYYNIWVVDDICDGQFGGYAYYPDGSALDGTVIVYSVMTKESDVLTHELGHGFNLFHTFEGDDSGAACPNNTDCSINGDRCCDTPPARQADCSPVNGCGPASPQINNTITNFMSYCSSRLLFTPDQKARMQATMLLPQRSSLATSLGCTPGGPGNAPAQPLLINGNPTAVLNQVVGYNVEMQADATSYDWQVEHGAIFSGASSNRVALKFLETGLQSITVNAVNGCGASISQSRQVMVTSPDGGADPVSAGQVEVFPNPVKTNVTVRLRGFANQTVTLEIYDAIGRQVYHSRIIIANADLRVPVDLQRFASGVYRVRAGVNGSAVNHLGTILLQH